MIDENGKNLGVIATSEALRLADQQGLDLIEIVPGANPPVCKIMDFGKFKYEREKGEREKSKKQKEVEVKGIRIGFTTGKHDLEMRAKKAEEFFAEGHKVRIQMRLVGRQKAHGALAMKKFAEFLEMISTPFAAEMPPRRLPQGIMGVIVKKP